MSPLIITGEDLRPDLIVMHSVLVPQINVLESYLDICICFKVSYNKKCENCDN